MGNDYSEFGLLVDRLQFEKGINTAELAKRLGIPMQNISALKRRKKPRHSTVKRLATALDEPVETFIAALN